MGYERLSNQPQLNSFTLDDKVVSVSSDEGLGLVSIRQLLNVFNDKFQVEEISEDGEYRIRLTVGSTVIETPNLNAVSIKGARIELGHLYFDMSDGSTIDAGYINNDISKYGVCRDMKTNVPQLTRLGDAKYLKAGIANGVNDTNVVNDFDKVYPWSEMKRWTIADDGTITSYEGDPNYAEDGSMGQVVTRIPEHYEMHYISEYTGKEYWYVSREKLNEYYHYVPTMYIGSFLMTSDADGTSESKGGNVYYQKFSFSNGQTAAKARGSGWHMLDIWEYETLKTLFVVEFATLDSQSIFKGDILYKGAYTNIFTDETVYTSEDDFPTELVTGNAFYCDSSMEGDELFQIGDEIMLPVVSNITPAELDYDGYAVRRIINVENMGAVSWDETLTYYKYTFSGSPVEMDVETTVGYNNTRNGVTNQIPSSSGQIMSFGVTGANVWRGIENLFGESYTWIDGILLYDDKYWVCDNSDKYDIDIYVYSDNEEIDEIVEENYKPLSFASPAATGYILKMGYDENTHLSLPMETGGTSDTGFCDNFVKTRNATSIFCCRFGGTTSLTGGLFHLYCMLTASAAYSSCARLSYRH